MATPLPPVLGACMPVHALPDHRDWLLSEQRDLELQSFDRAEVLNGGWRDLVAQAKDWLAGHTGRLGIHGPFWGFTVASMDPDVRAVVARRMDQSLDIAAELGATHVVIHSPFTTWDYNNLDARPGAQAQVAERVHATLAAAVKRAETLGIAFVLENIEDIDPRDRLELARSFGSPAVRLSVDTGHAHYAHGSTGAPPVDYFITSAGAMLEHVHVQDADGYADRHWPPGWGTIRWPAVFAAIATLPVQPRLVLEMAEDRHILPGWEHLKGLGLVR